MNTFITILGIIFCILFIYYFGGIGVIVEDYLDSKKYTEAKLWRVCKPLTNEERQLYQKIYDIIKNTDVKDWVITITSSSEYGPVAYDIGKNIRLIINYDGSKYEATDILVSSDGKFQVNSTAKLLPNRCVSMEAQDFLVNFAIQKRNKYREEQRKITQQNYDQQYNDAVKEALKHI